MLPQAAVAHKTVKRMRIRILPRRGDASFFDRLGKKLTMAFPELSVQINPDTASVLLTGEAVDHEAVAAYGRSKSLFELAPAPGDRRSMALSITAPLHAANDGIKRLTDGRVDLPGAIFFALLVFGAVELIRGKWRTPPWYTAFWYAFGLYSKSLIDAPLDALDVDADGD